MNSYSRQHGSRKGISTFTQLLEITHDYATIINSGLQAHVIFIDFSNAFEYVVNHMLIEKSKCIGSD